MSTLHCTQAKILVHSPSLSQSLDEFTSHHIFWCPKTNNGAQISLYFCFSLSSSNSTRRQFWIEMKKCMREKESTKLIKIIRSMKWFIVLKCIRYAMLPISYALSIKFTFWLENVTDCQINDFPKASKQRISIKLNYSCSEQACPRRIYRRSSHFQNWKCTRTHTHWIITLCINGDNDKWPNAINSPMIFICRCKWSRCVHVSIVCEILCKKWIVDCIATMHIHSDITLPNILKWIIFWKYRGWAIHSTSLSSNQSH